MMTMEVKVSLNAALRYIMPVGLGCYGLGWCWGCDGDAGYDEGRGQRGWQRQSMNVTETESESEAVEGFVTH